MKAVAVAVDQPVADIYKPSLPTKHAAEQGAGVPDYVVDVSRPVLPWRWTNVLLAPVELLAVAWSVPFVILVVGIPIALAVALVSWVGRFALSQF